MAELEPRTCECPLREEFVPTRRDQVYAHGAACRMRAERARKRNDPPVTDLEPGVIINLQPDNQERVTDPVTDLEASGNLKDIPPERKRVTDSGASLDHHENLSLTPPKQIQPPSDVAEEDEVKLFVLEGLESVRDLPPGRSRDWQVAAVRYIWNMLFPIVDDNDRFRRELTRMLKAKGTLVEPPPQKGTT